MGKCPSAFPHWKATGQKQHPGAEQVLGRGDIPSLDIPPPTSPSLPLGRVRVEAGPGHVSGARVAAVAIVKVVQHVVALHVTDAVAALPGETAARPSAVTAIVAGEGVLALGVTALVPHLAGLAAQEDSAAAQRRVVYLQQAELPGDVVGPESFTQSLVLPPNLFPADRGPPAIILRQVHHAVPHHLPVPQRPVLVVVGDQLHIIAGSLPTGRGAQRPQDGGWWGQQHPLLGEGTLPKRHPAFLRGGKASSQSQPCRLLSHLL